MASGAPDADIIEKIDIGGISLIRAAAKNWRDVIIVASKAQHCGVDVKQIVVGYFLAVELCEHFLEIAEEVSLLMGILAIAEFSDPTFAVLKHNNACGVATRSTIASRSK